MSQLPASDVQFLLAATGWIELDLPAEADGELNRIAARHQQHPEVLEVRWQACAAQAQWDRAVTIAATLVAVAPERDLGWIHRAYALRRASDGGLTKAWEVLRPAFDKFPTNALIPYNLACYAAQLGRLPEAWEWLAKARHIAGDDRDLVQMALSDPDLEALWARIRKEMRSEK